MRRLRLAAALVLALVPAAVGAAVPLAPAVTYAAPAGARPAGHIDGLTYRAILPSGRIINPAGASVVVGMNALGVALSPDGRFAIVSNDDERLDKVHSLLDPLTFGGYSLAVVDTATMTVVSRYRAPGERYFLGIVALRDPQEPTRTLVLVSGGPSNVVYAFTLDATGRLLPDALHAIAQPGPLDPLFADRGLSFPATIALSPDARHAYVVDELGGTVSAIDTRTRMLSGPPRPVGYFPLGAALVGSRLLVTNEGLMRARVLPAPTGVPPFATPAADPLRASSLSFVAVETDGTLSSAAAEAPPFVPALPMDPAPDGIVTVGGAHPTAVVGTPDGAFAFVAMSNVDRIATVALGPTPRVAGGTELRLFDRGPYGTQPSALALSRDGTRLYVALAGLNAVAVIDARDPIHLHRLGLIPTGWWPSALTLSADDRTLFVANAKGIGHDTGYSGDPTTDGDANAVWATLQKIDLAAVSLVDATRATLAMTRVVAPRPPLYPKGIKNVVLILEENKTFDAMLGDLGYGPADPAFVSFGESVTPNLHALARRFGLAGNFFADAEESDAGHQFAAAGIASLFTERTLLVKNGRRPLINKNEDPEDYPRAGYIFHALARHNISFRDYGDFVRVSGYDEGAAADPRTDDPNFAGIDDADAPTEGLGGLYALDVPAPAVLRDHVDLRYPGWNLRIRDERRAAEFVRDYGLQVAAGTQPRFTYIWLPADHGGFGRDIPPLAEEVADGDRALGKIVAYLSRLPSWRSTAIFVMPDDAQSSRDHVDEHRTYALVISPFAKKRYVGMRHTSTASVLKAIDRLFGLPPLSLGDLLATDMDDFFSPKVVDARPFDALPVPRQTASAEGRRIAALLAQTDQSEPDADAARAARIVDLSRRADALAAQSHAMRPDRYRAQQATLYRQALAVL